MVQPIRSNAANACFALAEGQFCDGVSGGNEGEVHRARHGFAVLQPIRDQSQRQRLHGRRRLLRVRPYAVTPGNAAMSASQRPSSSRKYSMANEKPVGDFGMNPSCHQSGLLGKHCASARLRPWRTTAAARKHSELPGHRCGQELQSRVQAWETREPNV